MADQFITCPHCGKKIQLTEAFTHDIEERLRKEFESETKRKEKEFEKAFEAKQKEYEEKLEREKTKLLRQAKREAEESVTTELADLKSEVEKKDKQLKEAQKKNLNYSKDNANSMSVNGQLDLKLNEH